jgi:hypothetical protein
LADRSIHTSFELPYHKGVIAALRPHIGRNKTNKRDKAGLRSYLPLKAASNRRTFTTPLDPATLQAVWKAHTDSEFITKDVEATLETMTEDAFVMNVPTGVGALGKDKRVPRVGFQLSSAIATQISSANAHSPIAVVANGSPNPP